MRILYFSQYFPPEIGATQNRSYEMASALQQAGHSVTVITEFPCHPVGRIPASYRGKLFERSRLADIEVIRTWVKASPSSSFFSRVAFFSSFALMSSLAGIFKIRGKYDLLYVTSPPLLIGMAGLAISFLRRLPMVFEVRDLWPESAVTMGQLQNKAVLSVAIKLEETCYRRAAQVVVTSQEIADALIQRGLAPARVSLIRNGANVESFCPDPEARRRVRARLNLEDRFVVLYVGLHGLAQDLGNVLAAAEGLQQQAPEILFLLIGEGPRKAQIMAEAVKKRLPNVRFLPAQPRDFIPDFFNAAEVTLAPLRSPHLRGAIPTKIFDSMACGVPVIAAVGGEAARIVEESRAGLAVPPGDPGLLREAILRLFRNRNLGIEMGRNGRAAAARDFSRQSQAKQLRELLEQVVTKTRSEAASQTDQSLSDFRNKRR